MRTLKLAIVVYFVLAMGQARGEQWKITAYDNCKLCCNKDVNHPAYGITASGKKAQAGYAACNWLPFNTPLLVGGKPYTVQDRGAKSLFGTKANPIKHLDIWMPTHAEARKFGVQYLDVEIGKLPTKIIANKASQNKSKIFRP